MPRPKLTIDQARHKVYLKHGDDIVLLSGFIDAKSKAKFKCSIGHEWLAQPRHVFSGTGCPSCFNIKQSIPFDLINAELSGRGYSIVGEYTNVRTKTKFKCKSGHEWETTPDSVRRGHGCPVCSIENKILSKSKIEQWLIEDGRGIKLIGDYVDTRTKTIFECADGHQWSTATKEIKVGKGCPSCRGRGFNPSAPAWEYIFTRGSYIKYGITGNLNGRMSTHKQYGDIELVHVRHHQNGQDALDWENKIKSKFGGKYVTDAVCPDGWTETLPLSHLSLLMEDKLI